MQARYTVLTCDPTLDRWTPQAGLSTGPGPMSLWELRTALKELRHMGYTAHRVRLPNGDHNSDPMVLVERQPEEKA